MSYDRGIEQATRLRYTWVKTLTEVQALGDHLERDGYEAVVVCAPPPHREFCIGYQRKTRITEE